MSLNKDEKLLVESLRTHLEESLGDLLPTSDDNTTDDNNFNMRSFSYQHRQINEMFALKAADLTHHTGIVSAFTKVHDYKYLNDPSFTEAFDKEMTGQAIPAGERKTALDIVPKIINELKEENKTWAEKDHGYHPQLDEVMKTTTGLKQYEE